MVLLDLLACLLATGAVLEVWMMGSILRPLREYMEDRDDNGGKPILAVDVDQPRWVRLLDDYCPNIVTQALACVYCLSHHVPWILMVLFVAPAQLCDSGWLGDSALVKTLAWLFRLPIYSLALTRTSNVLDSLLPAHVSYSAPAEAPSSQPATQPAEVVWSFPEPDEDEDDRSDDADMITCLDCSYTDFPEEFMDEDRGPYQDTPYQCPHCNSTNCKVNYD